MDTRRTDTGSGSAEPFRRADGGATPVLPPQPTQHERRRGDRRGRERRRGVASGQGGPLRSLAELKTELARVRAERDRESALRHVAQATAANLARLLAQDNRKLADSEARAGLAVAELQFVGQTTKPLAIRRRRRRGARWLVRWTRRLPGRGGRRKKPLG
jgi:hypothetical protein